MPVIVTKQYRVRMKHEDLFVQTWIPSNEVGTPIILLHDSLGCVRLWRHFPEMLAKACSRTIIAYDRLGFGQSDAHPDKLSIDFVQSEATGSFHFVRQYLGVTDFVVVGHSVGGGMAIACAASDSSACEGVVSISAQAFIDTKILTGVQLAKSYFEQTEQIEKLRKYHGSKAEWVLSAWVDTWSAENFREWSLDHLLPKVKSPLLCLHGDQDEYASVDHPRRLVSLVSGKSSLHVMKDCAHFPHRERPDEVLGLINTFLQEL